MLYNFPITPNTGGTANLHVVYYPASKATYLNFYNIIQSYEGAYGCSLGADSDVRRLIVYGKSAFKSPGPEFEITQHKCCTGWQIWNLI